jgi:hypothetical protein
MLWLVLVYVCNDAFETAEFPVVEKSSKKAGNLP